jgi:hypothetical protein
MTAAFSALFEKVKSLYRGEIPESLVHCDPVWTCQNCACENEISLLVSADGTVRSDVCMVCNAARIPSVDLEHPL